MNNDFNLYLEIRKKNMNSFDHFANVFERGFIAVKIPSPNHPYWHFFIIIMSTNIKIVLILIIKINFTQPLPLGNPWHVLAFLVLIIVFRHTVTQELPFETFDWS